MHNCLFKNHESFAWISNWNYWNIKQSRLFMSSLNYGILLITHFSLLIVFNFHKLEILKTTFYVSMSFWTIFRNLAQKNETFLNPYIYYRSIMLQNANLQKAMSSICSPNTLYWLITQNYVIAFSGHDQNVMPPEISKIKAKRSCIFEILHWKNLEKVTR